MDSLSTLLSANFIILCLALSALTFMIRRILEFITGKFINSKFYHDLLLPVMPLILSLIFGWKLKIYPLPDGFDQGGGKIFFFLAAGLLSGLVYRMAKAFIVNKINTFIPVSPPPPPYVPPVIPVPNPPQVLPYPDPIPVDTDKDQRVVEVVLPPPPPPPLNDTIK